MGTRYLSIILLLSRVMFSNLRRVMAKKPVVKMHLRKVVWKEYIMLDQEDLNKGNESINVSFFILLV